MPKRHYQHTPPLVPDKYLEPEATAMRYHCKLLVQERKAMVSIMISLRSALIGSLSTSKYSQIDQNTVNTIHFSNIPHPFMWNLAFGAKWSIRTHFIGSWRPNREWSRSGDPGWPLRGILLIHMCCGIVLLRASDLFWDCQLKDGHFWVPSHTNWLEKKAES